MLFVTTKGHKSDAAKEINREQPTAALGPKNERETAGKPIIKVFNMYVHTPSFFTRIGRSNRDL